MPAFRNAQTAGGGLLPNKMIPNSFLAQAFDAGEPAGEVPGGACEINNEMGGFPCAPGYAGFTPYFMGGIHPRVKRIIGQRLAKAARHVAYGDATQPYTGPVLVSCEMTPEPYYPGREPDPKHALPVPGPRLRLTFNTTLLGETDSLTVRQPGWELQIHGPPNPHTPYPMSIGLRGQPYADLHEAGLLSVELLEVLSKTWRPGAAGKNHNLLYTSPLEVRYGGSPTNLSDGGIWLSARLEPLCYNTQQSDSQNPSAIACGRNSTTGERLPGWNVASAALPLGPIWSSNITAVRYGWVTITADCHGCIGILTCAMRRGRTRVAPAPIALSHRAHPTRAPSKVTIVGCQPCLSLHVFRMESATGTRSLTRH